MDYSERPYHWQFKTNYGWQDAIGIDKQDASLRLLKSHKILNAGSIEKHLVVLLDSAIQGRMVDYDYWEKCKKYMAEKKKLYKIASLCSNSQEISKVCQALGVDENKVFSIYATTPKKEIQTTLDRMTFV